MQIAPHLALALALALALDLALALALALVNVKQYPMTLVDLAYFPSPSVIQHTWHAQRI